MIETHTKVDRKKKQKQKTTLIKTTCKQLAYFKQLLLRQTSKLLLRTICLMDDGRRVKCALVDATSLDISITYFISLQNSRETALYVLDCVFSVGVVGSLVVFVWRGSWALLDFFLYPEDVAKSSWCSLVSSSTVGFRDSPLGLSDCLIGSMSHKSKN